MSSRARRADHDLAAAFPWVPASAAAAGEAALQDAPVSHAPQERAAHHGHAQHAPPAAAADHDARIAAMERDAFAKGYAQGERAGLEAGAARADAMLRRLGATIEEIAALRRQIAQQSERQLVQLALAIARRIVNKEIAVDDEFLTAMARVALDRLGDAAPATIRLHPDDHARIGRTIATSLSGALQVTPDASVPKGGCFVESAFGFVDASVDAQFQELARVLLDGEMAGLQQAAVHA